MYEIKQVINLIENDDTGTYPTFAYSVLEKVVHGELYMDDSNKTALIGTDSGIFVGVGEPKSNRFLKLITEIFESRKIENKRFTLFSPSKSWDKVIKKQFKEEVRQIERYSFQFNIDQYSRLFQEEIPNEMNFRKIDKDIINNSQDFNVRYINEYWGSVSNFLKNGVGYCITHNNNLASECISIFSSSQFAEMDIVTQDHFRGIGLAQKVAEKFIIHCIEEKIQPRWDCDIDNIASIKLAEKLGFGNPQKYSLYVRK
ncbi:hypothetical protein A8F94_01740 [Bacillus sp. FJAT-27225]|uniref:GNAT family N-acetyltransferase n=1 Tax=Bacillus sp. FJAT-27225 TaxID=1743144 RepID=UPI00080C29B3|nr:GNAT family N-acetyltransferase [Bacillus sp. FJAT-27225]OCA90626.1 hypothetical protein A8F94_01740 [Bacillus sp. FJAT-27225]